MKNLKPVPADKKKSLGKLPTDVRNKMGYAKRGSMMKANTGGETVKKFPKDMLFRPTPKQAEEMSNDPTRKARLKKLLENRIKNTKPDSSKTKQKLKDALKKLGSSAGVGAGALATAKEAREMMKRVPKKNKGGEMASSRRKRLKDLQNPKSEYDKKGKLKYTAAKKGKMMDRKNKDKKPGQIFIELKTPILSKPKEKAMGGEMKKGYGAARQSGMGLQDENLIPGKSMDYYKDLM